MTVSDLIPWAVAFGSGGAMVAVLVLWLLERVRRPLRRDTATEVPEDSQQDAQTPERAPEQGPEKDPEEPRLIDEENPPRYYYYRPKDPDREPIRCTCHGVPIHPGDRVLIWPIPEHPQGGQDIFCSKTYGMGAP